MKPGIGDVVHFFTWEKSALQGPFAAIVVATEEQKEGPSFVTLNIFRVWGVAVASKVLHKGDHGSEREHWDWIKTVTDWETGAVPDLGRLVPHHGSGWQQLADTAFDRVAGAVNYFDPKTGKRVDAPK